MNGNKCHEFFQDLDCQKTNAVVAINAIMLSREQQFEIKDSPYVTTREPPEKFLLNVIFEMFVSTIKILIKMQE